MICIVLLAGCSKLPDEMETGMKLRSQLLQASKCSFNADITADYGDSMYSFSMACQSDPEGNVLFTVVEPETIAGITGKLSGDGGKLTFGETALHFALIADEQLSPVSAPWILLRTLRSGYMTSACTEEGNILLSIDDGYAENPLRLDIRLNQEAEPVHADILYDGRRILSVAVANFEIL